MEQATLPTMLEKILSLPDIKPTSSVYVNKLSLEERRILYKHWERYNLENWYPTIEEFTFKTLFFPLKKEVAEIFSKGIYRYNLDEVITQPVILQLETAIDEAIASLMPDIPPNKRRVFVRLSTRSPKDAILLDEDLIHKYIVDPLADTVRDWKDMNHINRVVWSGLTHSMKVERGKEAVRFLLQSDRVKEDCLRELEREEYNMNIIIREWVDIPIAYEFRSFITHKEMNAITQYFDNCFFEEVVTNKEKLLSSIRALWGVVRDKLPFEDGIVDFAVSQDLEKAYVIECNPLDQLTGGALFDYFKDWEVITGRKEFEFRIIESVSPLENKFEGVSTTWDGEIRKAKEIQKEKAEKDKEICLVM